MGNRILKLKTAAVILAVMTIVPASAQNGDVDKPGVYNRKGQRTPGFVRSMTDYFFGREYYMEGDPDWSYDDFDLVDLNDCEVIYPDDEDFELRLNSGYYYHFGAAHTPSIYVGMNVLCGPAFPQLAAGVGQSVGKNIELGFALGKWGFYFNDNFQVNAATCISYSHYCFGKGEWLGLQDDELVFNNAGQLFEGSRKVSYGYLSYWSVREPVCLEISSLSGKKPFIALGYELEVRFGGLSKVRLSDGERCKVAKNLDIVHPAGNFVLRAGFDKYGIMARYSQEVIFKSDFPVQAYPFTLAAFYSF